MTGGPGRIKGRLCGSDPAGSGVGEDSRSIAAHFGWTGQLQLFRPGKNLGSTEITSILERPGSDADVWRAWRCHSEEAMIPGTAMKRA